MKKLFIVTFSGFALSALGGAAIAQSSAYLLPYGMGAGMQVLNRALQPKPTAAPTPMARVTAYIAQAGAAYGAQAGDRRLVCEQWTGTRWMVIHVPPKQCNP